MPYFVIDASGTPYGPAELAHLQQWVAEGRLTPTTTVRDATTGQTMMASAIPGLFPSTPYGSPPSPYGAPYGNPPPNQYAAYPRPMQQAGDNELTAAWVLSILSLICCGWIGLPLGIIGMVFARRALARGLTQAQPPLIISYVGICLSALSAVMSIIGFASGFY